jgi:hypothetical protein
VVVRKLLRQIAATIREWLFPVVPGPSRLTLIVRREVQMALEFDIGIERTGNEAADIVHGVMVVNTTLAGEPRDVTVQVDPIAMTAGPFYGSDATEVNARFKWVDDAGNESPEATLTATLSDTISPDQPGPLAVVIRREIPDEDVPPITP